jgi:hypothetical protein
MNPTDFFLQIAFTTNGDDIYNQIAWVNAPLTLFFPATGTASRRIPESGG